MVPESAMRESAMAPLRCCGRGGGGCCVERRGGCRRRKIVGCGTAWKQMVKVMVVMVVAVVVVLVSPVEGKTNRSTLAPSRNSLQGLDSPCPMAFQKLGSRCYFYGYFPLNWFRAAEFCHSFGRGVSLATLETAEENYYVKKWLTLNGNHNSGVWVGGSDNGHNGKWAWFPTGQLVSYSNWGPSQPSGGDQHCMYLVGGLLGYQWADFHCEFDMNFLCEHSVNQVQVWRRRKRKKKRKRRSLW
ncbi:perlucin-like protein [Eriocheir sinensis]|uniref:perlucin-like protein n=1 Tax=Eriocheir sinensis TaxID=95602 RepID=UPI0021C9708F|nr:perlucin-like protein [Eriocheir sinensis]